MLVGGLLFYLGRIVYAIVSYEVYNECFIKDIHISVSLTINIELGNLNVIFRQKYDIRTLYCSYENNEILVYLRANITRSV